MLAGSGGHRDQTRGAQPIPHHHNPVVGLRSGLKTTYMVLPSAQATPGHLQRAAPLGHGKSLNTCETKLNTIWGCSLSSQGAKSMEGQATIIHCLLHFTAVMSIFPERPRVRALVQGSP